MKAYSQKALKVKAVIGPAITLQIDWVRVCVSGNVQFYAQKLNEASGTTLWCNSITPDVDTETIKENGNQEIKPRPSVLSITSTCFCYSGAAVISRIKGKAQNLEILHVSFKFKYPQYFEKTPNWVKVREHTVRVQLLTAVIIIFS